jgi:pimeloyl-ACP methyl ester carboxylesterase
LLPESCETGEIPVFLLHGLGRTAWSMKKIERRLQKDGFTTGNIDYPSRFCSPEVLTEMIYQLLKNDLSPGSRPVDFVTHSLGGVLIRAVHERYEVKNIRRVVMLSPPHQGSVVVDRLKKWLLFRLLMGPTGCLLGTKTGKSFPKSLGRVCFETGIITGNKSGNPLFSRWMPGEDDGTVSVEGAMVLGMKEFLIAPASHNFILKNEWVIDRIIRFLHTGSFLLSREKIG